MGAVETRADEQRTALGLSPRQLFLWGGLLLLLGFQAGRAQISPSHLMMPVVLFLIHVALSLRHLDRDRRREEPIQRLKLTRHLARRLTAEEQKCFLSLSVERQRTVMKWPPKKLKAYLAARREE